MMKQLVVHLTLLLGAFLLAPNFALRWGNKRKLLNEPSQGKVSGENSRGGPRGGSGGSIMGMAHQGGINMMKAHGLKPALSNTTPESYTSNKDALLPVKLSLISNKILKGYIKPSALAQDLSNVASFSVNLAYANAIITNNLVTHSESGGGSNIMLSPLSASGETDFGTNNQVTGVDEADLVKSDGTYVYAAYGDVLVVWNALSGAEIINVTMPAIPAINYSQSGPVDFVTPKGAVANSIICCSFYQPVPVILALLLESERLIVIVDGYGSTKRAALNLTKTVLYDLLATNVRVYDTSALSSSSKLPLIKDFSVNGYYQDARAVGEYIHIVTSSSVNTWEWLYLPLQRWYGNFSDDDNVYKAQAKALAENTLVPAFVEQLMAEINMFGTPTIVGISLWQSILSGMEDYTFSNGVFQAFTQITSFAATDPNLEFSLAGSFMPTSWGYTYSTTDMLIFSAEGWDWLPEQNATGPSTYFLGMKLVGATAVPLAIGSLPGSLLNQYSLDIYEGHLRAATNIPSLWRWPIFEQPNDVLVPVLESVSENQVVILKIPVTAVGGTGLFSEVSRISKLGKVGESFTAVRFFGNLAYAVTFERIDPFYVLSLDPANPRVLGELEITGFSSYLHSINSDNTLILAIGEEGDNNGLVLGLKISLFDTSNPASPTLVQSFTVEQDNSTWSSSSVAWDFKAFRYLPLNASEVGILIIPVQVSAIWPSTEGNFDGFIAYDISRQGITERGVIPHVESNQFYGCYSFARLPERSLVFNGNVTTLKGHSVINTDLDTFKTTWELKLEDGVADGNETTCYYWF